jgi:putative peptidoglycan lipid II flippase
VPPQYQRPVQDMGTSLGYGQGMEYQYFNAPQPSQPLPQLRQARLQQLREERMRNQQRRMNPDITSQIKRKISKLPANGVSSPSALPPQMSPRNPGMPVAAQMSPAMPMPPTEVSPSLIRPPAPLPELQRSPSGPPVEINQAQPAAVPAQDTGMMQKVRIGRAALILQGAFIASRILGLLRTSMFAFVFGTTTTSDAFLQAFLVPDLIFNIVAGGALSSAFIPVFVHYMMGERDEKTAWHIANSALNLAVAIMMGLALIAIIFAPWIVPIYNPGVSGAELNLIISLTRIMLLQSVIHPQLHTKCTAELQAACNWYGSLQRRPDYRTFTRIRAGLSWSARRCSSKYRCLSSHVGSRSRRAPASRNPDPRRHQSGYAIQIHF